ncbi:hypothetical protein CCYA_CCYA17G4377 [Cyanidiococcus yangmingshanensis]|nr:hypothetical protein CCYA_CCYA17G4377 [Cyanidiococcus yangmingshanensis]
MNDHTTTLTNDGPGKRPRLAGTARGSEDSPSEQGFAATSNGERQGPVVAANQIWKVQFILKENETASEVPSFSPVFTHQIFEDEEIRGYCNPRLLQIYDAVTLHCYLRFSFDSVSGCTREVTSVLPRIEALLAQCGGFTSDWDTFQRVRQESCQPEMDALTRIHTYARGGQEFGVYEGRLCSETDSPAQRSLRALHRRMQFLTLLYIDAASFIDDQDPRWLLLLVRSLADQRLVGYAAVYRFPAVQKMRDFEPNQERWRLAQLLILPSYQRAGHGSVLLKALYQRAQSVFEEEGRRVLEVNVEDPSPAFSRMRDLVDLEQLLTRDSECQRWARSITACSALPATAELTRLAQRLMITVSQMRRLYEILRLAALFDDGAAHASKREDLEREYRLAVKRRLYRDHEECFGLKDEEERKQMLSEMYQSLLVESYEPTIKVAQRRGLLPVRTVESLAIQRELASGPSTTNTHPPVLERTPT